MILIIYKLRLFFISKRLNKIDRKLYKKNLSEFNKKSLGFEFNSYYQLYNCIEKRIEHIKKIQERTDYYGYFK